MGLVVPKTGFPELHLKRAGFAPTRPSSLYDRAGRHVEEGGSARFQTLKFDTGVSRRGKRSAWRKEDPWPFPTPTPHPSLTCSLLMAGQLSACAYAEYWEGGRGAEKGVCEAPKAPPRQLGGICPTECCGYRVGRGDAPLPGNSPSSAQAFPAPPLFSAGRNLGLPSVLSAIEVVVGSRRGKRAGLLKRNPAPNPTHPYKMLWRAREI